MKISVTQIVIWECPACSRKNQAPGYTTYGDELDCEHCGAGAFTVDGVYLDCRPEKAKATK